MVLLERRRPNIYGGDFMKTQTITKIVLRDYDGNIIDFWRSKVEAAKSLGVSITTITNNLGQGKSVKRSRKIDGILSIEDIDISEK